MKKKSSYSLKREMIKASQVAVLIVSMLSAMPLMAQQKSINGTVVDEKGEPIIGANVSVKGTTIGTITDTDGAFSLSVAQGETLQVSYIGYTPAEAVVGNPSVYKIKLTEDTQRLDEVVVVGYGVVKKSDLTGAVVRADLSALQNSPNVNLAQVMKGTVPGLDVGTPTKAGQDPTIQIRGKNSISGTTNPLIVLDGIVFRGSMRDINPSDIESIDVLKDASSAAIYGSQAANGVLMITTKTVKDESKPIVEYSGSFSYQEVMNKSLKAMDAPGFIRQLTDMKISESRMGKELLQRNPNFDPTRYLRDEKAIEGYANGTNCVWMDLLTEPVPYIQNHSLSLRGKSKLSSYYLSFGYTDQQNLMKNDLYNRYSTRINLDAKVTDWLKIGTQSFFSINDLSGYNPSFSEILNIPALNKPYDDNGEMLVNPYRSNLNPLLLVEIPDLEKEYNLTGNFYAEVSIPWVKGLSYRANYSNNLIMNKQFRFNPYENSMLGQGNKYNRSLNNWTFDNIVAYKREFGKHAVNATLVYGVEKRSFESTNAIANNFSNPSLGYNFLGAGQSNLNAISSSAWQESSLYMMARAGYTFNDRYIFTGTIRRDGFSGFGSSNKFGLFPSAAVAWRLSEEAFLKDNVKWIDNLKLRLSYGSNGNRTAGRYSTMSKMSSQFIGIGFATVDGGYVFGDGSNPELTQAVYNLPNNNLRWETTTSFNTGLDFSILGGRLFGNYEFYLSNTRDLLYDISIPSINGYFPNSSGNLNVPSNIGKLRNVGHEISITGIPIRNKDFEWTVTGNFSTNRNEVISILGLDVNKDGKEDDLVSSNIFIGESLGVVYDYKTIGMWQVADHNQGIIPEGFTYGTYKIEGRDKSGKIDPDDRKILGTRDPLFRFSIINTLRYKDFELRVFVNSVQGGSRHYLSKPLRGMTPDDLSMNSFVNYDYWTPETPDAEYRQLGYYSPILGPGYVPYQSRSFVRLQELSLSYSIPKAILKKAKINRIRAFISGNNLLTLTSWKGWDPEADQGITSGLNGYPTMRNYTIGLNFEF